MLDTYLGMREIIRKRQRSINIQMVQESETKNLGIKRNIWWVGT